MYKGSDRGRLRMEIPHERRRRLREPIGVLTAIIAVTVLLKLAPVPVTGQASTAPTAWGEPDLQGIWTTDYEIPLERPARFADQEFFTERERADLDRERARIIGLDRRRSERGSEQDVAAPTARRSF